MKLPMHTPSMPVTGAKARRVLRSVEAGWAVTDRPLQSGDLSAAEFDRMAREHGARPLTAKEKRTLGGLAGVRPNGA